jgi:hypothetical protein
MGSRFSDELGSKRAVSAASPRPAWLCTADRLRMVRQARWIFLDRWAASSLAAKARAVRRMERDLATAESRPFDTDKHDWSILYRGSVLDD